MLHKLTPQKISESEQDSLYRELLKYSFYKDFDADKIKELITITKAPVINRAINLEKRQSLVGNIIKFCEDEQTAINLLTLIHEKDPMAINDKSQTDYSRLLYYLVGSRPYRFRLAELLIHKYGYDIDTKNETGNTALFATAAVRVQEHLCRPVVQFLLDEGANPCETNIVGKTPIDAAIESGMDSIRDMLLNSPKAAQARDSYAYKIALSKRQAQQQEAKNTPPAHFSLSGLLAKFSNCFCPPLRSNQGYMPVDQDEDKSCLAKKSN